MVKKLCRTKTAVERVKSRAKALTLYTGLNAGSAEHYASWSVPLSACEFDARDMADIAKANGMKSIVLQTKNGTRTRAPAGIHAATIALFSSCAYAMDSGGSPFLAADWAILIITLTLSLAVCVLFCGLCSKKFRADLIRSDNDGQVKFSEIFSAQGKLYLLLTVVLVGGMLLLLWAAMDRDHAILKTRLADGDGEIQRLTSLSRNAKIMSQDHFAMMLTLHRLEEWNELRKKVTALKGEFVRRSLAAVPTAGQAHPEDVVAAMRDVVKNGIDSLKRRSPPDVLANYASPEQSQTLKEWTDARESAFLAEHEDDWIEVGSKTLLDALGIVIPGIVESIRPKEGGPITHDAVEASLANKQHDWLITDAVERTFMDISRKLDRAITEQYAEWQKARAQAESAGHAHE